MGPPSAPTTCSGSERRRLRRDEAKTLKAEIVEKERQRLITAGRDGDAVKWMEASLDDQLKDLGALLTP